MNGTPTRDKILSTLFEVMTPGNTDDDRVRRIRELFVPVQGMEPTDQDIINSIIFTGSVDTQSAHWIRQLFTAAHAAEMENVRNVWKKQIFQERLELEADSAKYQNEITALKSSLATAQEQVIRERGDGITRMNSALAATKENRLWAQRAEKERDELRGKLATAERALHSMTLDLDGWEKQADQRATDTFQYLKERDALRLEVQRNTEGEKWMGAMLAQIMATAISGFADAVIVANQELNAEHALRMVALLAAESKGFRQRVAELEKSLAFAEDAASKGDLARQNAAGMEMEIKELRAALESIRDGFFGVHEVKEIAREAVSQFVPGPPTAPKAPAP